MSRYFADVTDSRMWLWRIYLCLIGWFLSWEGGTVSLVHLSGWMAISQSAAESRSCWSLRQSSCVLISLYMMLSSAKSLNLLCDRYSGKSFM